MMLRQKSSPWACLKYVYVLPLAAIAVAAFARPEISQELEKISSAKISDFAPIKEALLAESQVKKSDTTIYVVSKKATNNVLFDTLKVLSALKITERPVVSDSTPLVVIGYSSNRGDSTLRVSQNAAKKKLTVGRGFMDDTLILIDGKESTREEMEKTNPDTIESISVLKDGQKIYGDKGKNGVIIIALKKKTTNEKK